MPYINKIIGENNMFDGDDWKLKGRMEEWNSPEKIALYEYSSIMKAFYENVLRPVVQKGEQLDRTATALTKSDLEWKVNESNFEELPFKTKEAYQNFYNFVVVLDQAKDEEVQAFKDVLEPLFRLAITCATLGQNMKEFYQGRNPCRPDQHSTITTIAKSETLAGSQLLEAAKKMVDTCIKCPYK